MRKKEKTIFTYLIIIITVIANVQTANAQTADELAIRQLLAKQSAGWNRGNLEEYMKGYWESDSLVFIGKSGPKYGYKTTLENYKKSYPDTATMGKLAFDLLQVKPLSPEYYSVMGKWHLQRSIGNVEGYFTLLLKKLKNEWVIVSDHSS